MLQQQQNTFRGRLLYDLFNNRVLEDVIIVIIDSEFLNIHLFIYLFIYLSLVQISPG